MKFRIMGKKGDLEVCYDDVETQQIKFDELKSANYLPMVIGQGGKSRLLQKFDPDVEEILWSLMVAGG